MANKKKPSRAAELNKLRATADRRVRAERDPWFGHQRRAGEMGRDKSKAGQDRRACRDRNLWV